jgi:hypothetical protein
MSWWSERSRREQWLIQVMLGLAAIVLGWLLLEGGVVVARGGPDDLVEVPAGTRTALAVPGAEVTIHWLELAEGLTQAQAAAAARLMLADASAEGLADMHVAVGIAERGLTPVALAPNASMAEWAAGDPDMIVPSSLLLLPPEESLVRYDAGAVPDYRGAAAAFSVESDLAALLIGEAPVRAVDDAEYEAGLAVLQPYLRRISQDPWHRPYLYAAPGANGRPYSITSLGADGRAGGSGKDADITSN